MDREHAVEMILHILEKFHPDEQDLILEDVDDTLYEEVDNGPEVLIDLRGLTMGDLQEAKLTRQKMLN